MKLSEIIKTYREENRLSQREFARMCELSNSLISILEMGVNPQTGKVPDPDLRTLRRLAYGMGLKDHRELLDMIRGETINQGELSELEQSVVTAFRSADPGTRSAVCKLLDVEEKTPAHSAG